MECAGARGQGWTHITLSGSQQIVSLVITVPLRQAWWARHVSWQHPLASRTCAIQYTAPVGRLTALHRVHWCSAATRRAWSGEA